MKEMFGGMYEDAGGVYKEILSTLKPIWIDSGVHSKKNRTQLAVKAEYGILHLV